MRWPKWLKMEAKQPTIKEILVVFVVLVIAVQVADWLL